MVRLGYVLTRLGFVIRMSLDEIEWTESEGESDENLFLNGFDQDSDEDVPLDKALQSRESGVPLRSRRTREEELEPEVEEAYQEARNLYTQGNYDDALALLEEAIKHEANSKLLFNLLVSIHEERKDFERALIARVAVAHLDKRDKDTWIDIAERSVALGHLAQAAVFFQHVSKLDSGNWTLLCTRAELYMQLGQISQALSLYQRVRTKFFPLGVAVGLDDAQRTNILLNIAGTLKDLGRIEEATKIYLDVFTKSLQGDASDPPEVELDWQNLNILAELLFDQKQYTRVITLIKDGSRWLNLRGGENSFWQKHNFESDAEFDDRRVEILARADPEEASMVDLDENLYFMPADIRIWLLECRLKQIPPHILLNSQPVAAIESLPCVADALCHLVELKKCQPVEIYADLYKRAAAAVFNARLYTEARELYTALTGIAHETLAEYLEMTVQVAKCEMELNNIDRSEYLYNFVLQRDPVNQEALVALGEIYAATSRASESQNMLNRLMEIRRAEDKTASDAQTDDAAPQYDGDEAAASHENRPTIFVDDAAFAQRPRPLNARPTRAEKAETERQVQQRTDDAFAGLTRYQTGLSAGNLVATMEWLRFADELVDLFASHRKFFPVTKHKELPFNGSSLATVSERIDRLRLAQEDLNYEEDSEHGDRGGGLSNAASDEQVWRGQPLKVWFRIIMQCALEHARTGNNRRAQRAIDVATTASIFNTIDIRDADTEAATQEQETSEKNAATKEIVKKNIRCSDTIQLVALSCGYMVQDAALVGDLLRHMQTQFQFDTQSFKLYVALLSSSSEAVRIFGSSNNQKFFLRQIKALDSVVHYKKHVSGMAKVMDPEHAPTSDDPHLLLLYVYIMMLGPSYIPALTYLIRARAQLPTHPLVLLIYGVIEMHRAIQRTSANRHLQIAEGLSFITEYADRRGDAPIYRMESNYNMGRFFHGIGLLADAVHFYTKAVELSSLVEPEYNIGREAAYNLYLIYSESGNADMAASIVDQHLVI